MKLGNDPAAMETKKKGKITVSLFPDSFDESKEWS